MYIGKIETFPISRQSVKLNFETKLAGLTAKASTSGTMYIDIFSKSVKW